MYLGIAVFNIIQSLSIILSYTVMYSSLMYNK